MTKKEKAAFVISTLAAIYPAGSGPFGAPRSIYPAYCSAAICTEYRYSGEPNNSQIVC